MVAIVNTGFESHDSIQERRRLGMEDAKQRFLEFKKELELLQANQKKYGVMKQANGGIVVRFENEAFPK